MLMGWSRTGGGREVGRTRASAWMGWASSPGQTGGREPLDEGGVGGRRLLLRKCEGICFRVDEGVVASCLGLAGHRYRPSEREIRVRRRASRRSGGAGDKIKQRANLFYRVLPVRHSCAADKGKR